MAMPESYKSFRRTADGSSVEMTEEKLPSSLQSTHVLIRIYAVSLNYRDVAMMNGKYPVQVIDRGIPASDCAAEVITVGSDVKDFILRPLKPRRLRNRQRKNRRHRNTRPAA